MQDLNEAQRHAVSHCEGPMLVVAGPGSGKTRVITERIRYLTTQRGIRPDSILVITFTKAAATEMKQRYEQSDSSRRRGVHFGTFHAIFFMILKHAYHYTAQNIIREDVRRDILRRLLHRTELEISDENEFITDLEAEISRVKGECMDLGNYYSSLCSTEVFRQLYQGYQEQMRRRRLIDFDDMLVYCYELLSQREDILQLWQKQFSYILIDEFQDISRVQYEIVRLLGGQSRNIFVVGDDDQSIYGFRGAKPEMMKCFLKDYPEAEQCFLEINYRCHPQIVEAAGRLIQNNKSRFPKAIRSPQTDGQMGQALEICEFENEKQQNERIREQIIQYHQDGIPYRELAVLFRTNTQARMLSAKLLELNIPFLLKERVPNLYEHWIVQDVLAYIRVAQGNRERSEVLRIINRPKRYVHRNAFTEPYVDWEELKRFYEDKDWMVDRIEQLQQDLSMLAKMKPYAAVNFIRRGIGYDEFVREYAQSREAPPDDMLEILDELQEEAKAHASFDAWFDAIIKYKEELQRQSRQKEQREQMQDAVQLMTMHGSKGLEFSCVFLPDANEEITPHRKAVLTADMEEERRMFYVAMTRAKEHLHIYSVKERFGKAADVSRFVEELH